MGDKELIIPVRLDSSKAKEGLRDVGRAGKQAGDDVKEGMDHAGGGIKSAGQELKSFLQAQMGLSAAKNLATALGDEYRKVSEEIARASKEFQAFRQSLQGVASLTGQQNTNKFVESEIQRAQKANVTPEEMKQFRDSFLAKASLYVGEGKDAKLSTKDADEFQQYLSEYAKQKGVSQQEMAGFGGGLLAQQKGKTTAAEMKKQAGKVFATLEASSAPVAHLLPAMTRAQAAGFSANEASQVLSMMPEIAPEEESTYMLRAVSALRETTQKGKGDKLGLKKGMDPYKLLTTAVENIKKRQAAGEDLDDLITEATHGEEVSGRALKGLVGQGPEGFARWKRLQEEVPDNQLEQTIQEGRKSDAGRQYAVDAAKAAERARMGMRNDAIARRRDIAETELMKSGAFERPATWGEMGASIIPGGDMDRKSIQTNLQMIRRARAELGEASGVGDAKAALNRGTTDELLRELIPKIAEMEKTGGSMFTRRKKAAEELGYDKDDAAALTPEQRGAREVMINRREILDARKQLGQGYMPGDEKAALRGDETAALLRMLIQKIEEQNHMMRDEKRNAGGGQPGAGPPIVVPPPLVNPQQMRM